MEQQQPQQQHTEATDEVITPRRSRSRNIVLRKSLISTTTPQHVSSVGGQKLTTTTTTTATTTAPPDSIMTRKRSNGHHLKLSKRDIEPLQHLQVERDSEDDEAEEENDDLTTTTEDNDDDEQQNNATTATTRTLQQHHEHLSNNNNNNNNNNTKNNNKSNDNDNDEDDDNNNANKPSWITEMYSAWDEEIQSNMSEEKQTFFLNFSESGDTVDDDEEEMDESRRRQKRNVRNHMRQFIRNEQNHQNNNNSNKGSILAPTVVHHSYFLAPTTEANSLPLSRKNSAPMTIGELDMPEMRELDVDSSSSSSSTSITPRKLSNSGESVVAAAASSPNAPPSAFNVVSRSFSTLFGGNNNNHTNSSGSSGSHNVTVSTSGTTTAIATIDPVVDTTTPTTPVSSTTTNHVEKKSLLQRLFTNNSNNNSSNNLHGNNNSNSNNNNNSNNNSNSNSNNSNSNNNSNNNQPHTLYQWIQELTKYEQRLNQNLKDCKSTIRELKNKEQVERLFIYRELNYLKSCRLNGVIRVFRSYYISRIMELQRKARMERLVKQMLRDRLNDTIQALDILKNYSSNSNGGSSSEDYKTILPSYLIEEKTSYFLNVDQLIVQRKPLLKRRMIIKQLEVQSKRLEREYQVARKNSGAHKKSRTKREQQGALRRIVEQFPVFEYSNDDTDSQQSNVNGAVVPREKPKILNDCSEFIEDVLAHVDRTRLQDEFNCIVGDARSAEGQSIRTFVNEVNNVGFDRVPSAELVEYASSFVNYINKLNGLTLNKKSSIARDARTLKVLRYLVHYFIFGSVIASEIDLVESIRNDYDNNQFCTQQKMVASLTAEQLGVAQRFLPINNDGDDISAELLEKQNEIQSISEPYAVPIDILSCISYCTVPSDMLHCVHVCSKQIHLIAKAQCELKNKDFTFGADELIPLLVYVVSRASLSFIHTNLALMAKFMSPEEREEKPELVYYLTCLEGAVMYVSGLTEQDVSNIISSTSSGSGETVEDTTSASP